MSKQSLAFVKRLNEVCDELHIPEGRGRPTALARMFKQSQQTVNLWFKGETEPKLDTSREIAVKAKVQIDWLVTGREPKYLEKQRLRPKLEHLIRAAERLPDYKVDQLIKIVPAIDESDPADDDGIPASAPGLPKQGRAL